VIAKVEPLTSARALRGPFDYRLPAAMADVGVGSLLLVPFGRRRTLGVVVDLAETSEVPPERLVEPVRALESGVPPELVNLGLWVAQDYCSTPARGLALVLPPGTGTGARRPVGARRELIAELARASGERAAGSGRLGERQRAALGALAEGPVSVAELRRRSGCSHSALRSLEGRGLIELRREERRRRPDVAEVGAAGRANVALSPAQREALARIVERLEDPSGVRSGGGQPDARPGGPPGGGIDGRFLLHGVTGSGKTEVYLRAAAAALERGRSAIVLVPEIALTPQTAGRFRERFGERVAIMHSALAMGERYDEWLRLRRGDAQVCVGPRSAVFAPVRDLGLIVVDEEHDASYKQEGDPRYDARRVAERRAAQAGAVLVAGSATPRPESRHRLGRLVLAERIDGRSLPPVELVRAAGVAGPLHERTREALDEVRVRGEKAIVLLNRRGWSNFVACGICGEVRGCPDCDVSLVLHRADARLACHHCGHGEPVAEVCPACGSVSLRRHGAGTERLERELEEAVAPLPVLRLDADTAGPRGGPGRVLAEFDRARAGVLVGTQMVAKGHDFPSVTLGVVLDADATLRFPDFRSEERTFALVAQLAGRSGRGTRGGRVIVQALDPGARSLAHAARHDAEGFLAGELERRRALRYPPFAHLIRVVCSAEEPGPETAAAEAIRERIDFPGAVVLGPAALFRRHGRERSQLVIKAADRAAAVAAVRGAVEGVAGARGHLGVHFAVDVDPQ
jgi:primosomal protein N' (replication factor Y) (superfamily II helicase)